MELEEVFKKRHSVRAFEDREIEEEKINSLLAVLEHVPSAGNLRAFQVRVIKDDATKQKLAEAALGQSFVSEAPLCLVFCADANKSSSRYGKRGAELYSLQDATIACTYVMLKAVELGLASCWVGAFYDDEVMRILALEKGLRPVAILPIGYEKKRWWR